MPKNFRRKFLGAASHLASHVAIHVASTGWRALGARRACKPDSVQGLRLWMTIPLPTVSPRRSSCQPGPLGRWHPWRAVSVSRPVLPRGPYLALLRVGLAVPVLLPVPRWAFTPPFHRYPPRSRRRTFVRGRGSLFSVALSLGLPPPGVTRHPCQRESGLSSKPCGPAVIQPSARGWG